MHFSRILTLSSMLLSLTYLATAKTQKLQLMHSSYNALWRGLQFMEDNMKEINLDGAFGCRLVGEFLTSFLESSPRVVDNVGIFVRDDLRGMAATATRITDLAMPYVKMSKPEYYAEFLTSFLESSPSVGNFVRNVLRVLAAKATRIADSAIPYIKMNEPEYYADVGRLLDKSESSMWYTSRVTKPRLQIPPVPCPESVFNETKSDTCLQGIIGRRSDKSDSCSLSSKCMDMMTKTGQRGYVITHQVLYFQLMEMHNCFKKSQVKYIPESLQDILCSNVMRDAEEIVNSGYPLSHRDLFMEQIGLCGMWGYRDFYNEEWLKNILQWQQKSGCYANRKRWYCTENLAASKNRVKRAEKILENGCLSHKTTVALLALAINIRFNVESISETL